MGSSLRRRRPRPVGGVAPPRPQLFSFTFPFLLLFLRFRCTDAELSNRVAERSSAVRGCRAALSHMVLFACCLLPFCTLVFSLSWHTHLFFVSSMRYCLLARAFSLCFCLSSLLALTPCLHARFWTRLSPQGHRPARPVNGSGVPSVPELSLVFVSLRPLGGLPHLCLLRVFSCSFSGYLPLFSCGVCTCSLPPICSPRRGTGRCRRRGRLALGLQPSAAPASAGWGSGDPPAPAVSVFFYVSFFRLALCSYVGLSNRVTERSSGVRGCQAALSHMVLFVCCLLPCLIVIFLFFLSTPIFSWLIADTRFFTRCCLLARSLSLWFRFSSLLAPTPCLHARFWTRLSPQGYRPVRPVNGGGVPSVPELCFVLVSVTPVGWFSAPVFVACIFVFVFWLSFRFFFSHAAFAHVFFLSPICSFGDAFSSYFLCAGLCDLFSFHYCFRDASYECFCFRLRFPAFT